MAQVSDKVTLGELVTQAAKALTRAGLEHRIDLYRDVEVDDPAVRMMLGRSHRVRLRIRITATSLLFEGDEAPKPGKGAAIAETTETAKLPHTA